MLSHEDAETILKAARYRVDRAAGWSDTAMARACELLMAENYQVVLGRFERSGQDGTIGFGIALPYRDGAVTAEQVHWAIDIGVAALDQMIPRLEQLREQMPLRLAV